MRDVAQQSEQRSAQAGYPSPTTRPVLAGRQAMVIFGNLVSLVRIQPSRPSGSLVLAYQSSILCALFRAGHWLPSPAQLLIRSNLYNGIAQLRADVDRFSVIGNRLLSGGSLGSSPRLRTASLVRSYMPEIAQLVEHLNILGGTCLLGAGRLLRVIRS